MASNSKKTCPNQLCRTENDASEQYCISCGDELDVGFVPPTKLLSEATPVRVSAPPPSGQRGGAPKTVIADNNVSAEILLRRLGPQMMALGEPYNFRDRTTFTIGREKGDILIQTDPMVSKEHARVQIEGMQIYVEDLGSRNGVFLRLRKDDHHELADGDGILLGSEFMVFRMPAGSAPAQDAEPPTAEVAPAGPMKDLDLMADDAGPTRGGRQATAIEIGTVIGDRPAKPVRSSPAAPARAPGGTTPGRGFRTEFFEEMSAAPQASVDRFNHGTVTASLYLFLPRVSFGREGCTFNFPVNKISRQHAEIYAEKGHYILRDLGSQNGTFVRVRGARVLRHGDQFRIGNSCFELDAPGLGS